MALAQKKNITAYFNSLYCFIYRYECFKFDFHIAHNLITHACQMLRFHPSSLKYYQPVCITI